MPGGSVCLFLFLSPSLNPSFSLFCSLALWSSSFICPSGQLVEQQLLKAALHETSENCCSLAPLARSSTVSILAIKLHVWMHLRKLPQWALDAHVEKRQGDGSTGGSLKTRCDLEVNDGISVISHFTFYPGRAGKVSNEPFSWIYYCNLYYFIHFSSKKAWFSYKDTTESSDDE